MLQIIFMLTIFHLFVSVLFGLTATQSPRSELPYIILRNDLLYFVVLVPSLLAVFAVPYNHIILRDLSICSKLVCRLLTVPILPVAFPRPRTRPSEKKRRYNGQSTRIESRYILAESTRRFPPSCHRGHAGDVRHLRPPDQNIENATPRAYNPLSTMLHAATFNPLLSLSPQGKFSINA
jgi:hypothetical protein